jgi:hypothetical protein
MRWRDESHTKRATDPTWKVLRITETSKGCDVLLCRALPFDVSAMRKTYEHDARSSRRDAAIACDLLETQFPI